MVFLKRSLTGKSTSVSKSYFGPTWLTSGTCLNSSGVITMSSSLINLTMYMFRFLCCLVSNFQRRESFVMWSCLQNLQPLFQRLLFSSNLNYSNPTVLVMSVYQARSCVKLNWNTVSKSSRCPVRWSALLVTPLNRLLLPFCQHSSWILLKLA